MERVIAARNTTPIFTFSLPTKVVRGVCNFLSSVLSQQKFEATDIKALGASQLSDSVTAPSYSSVVFGKYILEGWTC